MKILNTADIHIHDYANHNLLSPEWRLEQFKELAHRLAFLYKKNGCSMIVVSGDSLQTPRVPPHVEHALDEFYSILSEAVGENGGEVVVQLGNHDKDSRSEIASRKESVVTLVDRIQNVRYIHRGEMVCDSLRVAFQDFLPTQDVSWYEGKVDILFNHFTDVGPGWNGQEIDKEKFGIMFFGDIHSPYHRGNLVSIGNPIPHRLGDSCEGKVLIIDTAGGDFGIENSNDMHTLEKIHYHEFDSGRKISFYWDDVITPETPFLRIYRPDKPPRRWAGCLKYDVPVEYAKLNKVKESEFVSVDNALDVDSVINANLTDQTRPIHTEVLEIAKKMEIPDSAVDMNFKMIKTYIKNYRSIDELTINWQSGVLRVSGDIGAGKSSIAQAMMYCFYGDRGIESQFRDTANIKKDWLVVDVVLEYKGCYYRVERGWERGGWFKYWKSEDADKILLDSYLPYDDPQCHQRIQTNKIGDLEAIVRADLPFLDLDKMMYVSQKSSGLFSDMKKTDRIEMIAKLLGWSRVIDYSDTSSTLLKESEEKISEVRTDIARIEGNIETIDSMNLKLDETDYQSLIQDVNAEAEKNKLVTKQMDTVNAKRAELNGVVNTLNVLKAVPAPTIDGKEMLKSELDGAMSSLSDEMIKLQIRIDEESKRVEVVRAGSRELAQSLQSKVGRIDLLTQSRNNNTELMKTQVANIEVLKVKHANALAYAQVPVELKCLTCGQDIHDQSKVDEAQQKLWKEVELASKVLEDAQKRLNELASSTGAIMKELQELGDRQALLDQIQAEMDKIQNTTEDKSLSETMNLFRSRMQSYTNYLTQLSSYQTTAKSIEDYNQKYNQLSDEFAALTIPTKEEVDAANAAILEASGKVAEYQSKMADAARTKDMLEKRALLEVDIETKKDAISGIETRIEAINAYRDLTSFTGPIIQSILQLTSQMLSTDTMRVKTIEEKKNGNHKPDLTLSVLIGENWKDYDQLSGGQCFYADIQFMLSLAELTSGIGLVIFDEAFKFLNPDMIEEIGTMIQQSDAIRDILVITHYEGYSQFDHRLHAHLNEQGISVYS